MPEELLSELAEWEVLNAKPFPWERDKVQEWRERCLCGGSGSTGGWCHLQGTSLACLRPRHRMASSLEVFHYRALRDARLQKQPCAACSSCGDLHDAAFELAEYRRSLPLLT